MRRAEFEPTGWRDALVAAPPFSRLGVFVIAAGLTTSALVCLTSRSPMTVNRSSKYHLRAAALGLLVFAGEDFASDVLARSSSWGHRKFGSSCALLNIACQVIGVSWILTEDSLGGSRRLPFFQVAALTLLQAFCTLSQLPKWVALPRMTFYAISLFMLPMVGMRCQEMDANNQSITLSGFQIAV